MENFIVISNGNMEVTLCRIGASIYDIKTPDRNGEIDSVLVTTQDFQKFANADSFFGKTIGRTGGRIADNKFTLDGVNYTIISNDPNGLHGGIDTLAYKVFDYEVKIDDKKKSVIFKYISKDMESGYPGNLTLYITYSLYINENKLELNYRANTDKKTLLNLSNHAYFNLSGSVKNNALDHELFIAAKKMERVEKLLPREIVDCSKIYDFSTPHKIKDYINDEEIVSNTNGYDYPYIFDDQDINRDNVILYDEASGRRMKIQTSYPTVVVYTCNYCEDIVINNGKKLAKNDAVCLECMYHPNTINSDFLKQKLDVLDVNETYNETIIFKFDTK